MNRRAFIGALAGSVLAPERIVAAQQGGRTYRVGLLFPGSPGTGIAAFGPAIRRLGWVPGQNLILEQRYARGDLGRLPALAAELVGLKVDVLVVSSVAIPAARAATRTIPTVMAFAGDDPFEEGPEAAARSMGLQLQVAEVAESPKYEGALAALRREAPRRSSCCPARRSSPSGGGSPTSRSGTGSRSWRPFREGAEAGGLMAYGPNIVELWGQRVPIYVDRILKGARPDDLPIEQPTKYELVVNLRTAKTHGLTIPPSLLLRADQVLE